jgi:LPS-assembly protein
MRLKDVKLYAKEVPVLYTPYLGFSLERQRHSGFLMPHVAYGKDEGFYYEQPYFWAISPSMDMELNPSIRTKRGYGFYGTFRFVDSPWSHGIVRSGYFSDKDSFTEENNLENKNHYGVEVYYESSNVLKDWKPDGYRDGLYINVNLFNDIDYHNLQYSTLNHLEETSKFKESRLNYFLYNDEQYFGFRSRYFIDTTSKENNETIQELPSLQYHKYSTSLMGDYLSYSFDAQLQNYWREEGVRALRGIARLPVEYHIGLLNDFLNLAVEEEFTASDTKFFEGSSLNISEDHYASAVLHHSIELSSDLVKGYENGIHTLQLGVRYTKSTLLAEGDLKLREVDEKLIGDYDLNMLYDSRYAFGMHNFWHSYNGKFDIDHLIVADYYPEPVSEHFADKYFKGEGWSLVRQELHARYGKYSLTTRVDYAIYAHALSQLSNTFSYRGDALGLSITHTRKEDFNSEDQWISQNEITIDTHYKQSDSITWYGGYTYDIKENISKNWKAGLYYDRKCWNVKLIFKQDITPVLTKNGGGSIRNNAIYFQFNLVPFGGIGTESFQKISNASGS